MASSKHHTESVLICSDGQYEAILTRTAAHKWRALSKQCQRGGHSVSAHCIPRLSQEKRQARVEAESARREAEEAERSRAEELKRQESERVQSEQASERRYATVLESLVPHKLQTHDLQAWEVAVHASAHLGNSLRVMFQLSSGYCKPVRNALSP